MDLLRDDRRVRGGSKAVWAFIIVFVNFIGPILYFLVGREDGPVEPQAPGPGAMPGWGSPHDPPIVVGPETGRTAPGGPEDVHALAGRDVRPAPDATLLRSTLCHRSSSRTARRRSGSTASRNATRVA